VRINADTLNELLMSSSPAQSLESAWADIARDVPELAALDMNQGGKKLHKDNVAHTIAVTAKTPPRLRVRLTALFHDVGKPPTRKIEAGLVTFHNHEAVGGHLTRKIMERLGYDTTLTNEVAKLVRLSGSTKGSEVWTDTAVRRLMTNCGDLLEDLLDFVIVDVTSRYQRNHDAVTAEVTGLRAHIEAVRALDAERAKRPVIDGAAIMDHFNLAPGPEVGRLRKLVFDAQEAAHARGENFSEEDAWAVLEGAV